jgi:hypothetical protein
MPKKEFWIIIIFWSKLDKNQKKFLVIPFIYCIRIIKSNKTSKILLNKNNFQKSLFLTWRLPDPMLPDFFLTHWSDKKIPTDLERRYFN